MQFAILLLIARITGPSGNGVLSLFLTDVTLFILFFGLSGESAILYFSVKNKLEASHIIGLLVPVVLVQLTFCIVVYFLSSSLLHYTFFQTGQMQSSLLWGIIFVLSNTVLSYCNAYLNANHIFFKIAAWYVLVQLIFLIVFAVFYFGLAESYPAVFTTRYLLPAYSSIYLLHAIISFFFVLKLNAKKWTFKIPFQIITRPFLTYIFYVATANVFQFFAYKMDIWFLDHYHSKYEIGLYSMAVRVAQLVWVLPQLFAALLFPLTALNHHAVSPHNFKKNIKMFALISGAGILLAIVSYPFAIKLFAGNAYAESYQYFLLLLPGVILFSINIILAARLAGQGNVRVNFEASAICFVLMLALDYLLIPSMKGKGAAIATSIGYSISTVYTLVRYFQLSKVSPVE